MTTYPGGAVTRYGLQLLQENVDPAITFTSADGDHIFYLSGPLAPLPKCQEGVALQSISGLHPMFTHLDTRGARQDGVTWQDTVYDPPEIDVTFDVGGRTAAEYRQVMRDWIGVNDPKNPGTLSWFTPEFGEWTCKPRLLKIPQAPMPKSPARHYHQKLGMVWRIDDAFWQSSDSVSTFVFEQASVSDDFNRADDFTGLGGNWTQIYETPADGVCEVRFHTACWGQPGGVGTANKVTNRYITDSDTDNQIISIQIAGIFSFPFPSSGSLDILARMSADSTSYVKMSISNHQWVLSRFNSGVETVMRTGLHVVPPIWTETFTFVCGTDATKPRQYQLLRDGFQVFTHTESGTDSHVGASYRGWGFGMGVGAGILEQKPPALVDKWWATDNTTITQSGFLPLTNRGTEDVWPRYLVYGPGTFTFGNGPGSVGAANPITFGPLVAGQIALITTDPRKRSVVDLSPAQDPQPLSIFEEFVAALQTFAINHNTPPLLSSFESLFGISPPQGVLYSLLDGRFTRQIPGHIDGTDLSTDQIAVSIAGASPLSKIVGAITPLRRWPE